MSGKGQEQKKRNNPQQTKPEEQIRSSNSFSQNISNQEMMELMDLESEEEEEKKEENKNDNSGGDNSGDGIPGGENPNPENNPDEKKDDVQKEESGSESGGGSGSGSAGDPDNDENKEFEINTSKKKKAAGAPLNSSKILPSAKNGEESDNENNIAGEFETLDEYESWKKPFEEGESIKKLIKGKDETEAINAIREKYGLTKEEIKTDEAVPRMMNPYFRAAISNLSRDKRLSEEKRKALEDFSEEMDQQMMINAMKSPDDQQIANLEQYFRNNGDEKQLQRELKDKHLGKLFFGVEGIKSNLKSWMNGNPGNGKADVLKKKNKELEMQKESARSLFKIFLLMQIGELKQRNTDKVTDRKKETDWKHNVSDLFAHGGRVMITTGEREEAGTQDLLSSIFSKTSALEKRSAATHYITDGKEEPGSLEEEKGNIAAIKGKWDSDWSNYGMPVAIGGSGNLGPDKQRAILNDNRNGHLYVGAREARKYKRGGILIGLESDAPYRMNHWGHYHTAKATPERIKSTGAMASDLHGDKTSGRNLYLRDIKNEELITIMKAVDKEFDKLYGGERKEEYEEILQKITGKKLEQKELETILKNLTGLEELHIDLKKPILNKPILNKQEEIQPEEIESEDEAWDDMFNPKGFDPWKDMATKPAGKTETDENIIKRDRFEVDLSRPDSTDKGKEFLENIEFPNDKAKELFEKNTEFQKLQEYLALKKKKETDGQNELTEEEKEKIEKFENRKKFEVGDDKKQKDNKNPENEENKENASENEKHEENPLKSEEIPSLNNYGPLLSEEEMDAIDPGAPDPDKEIIQERLKKEPLKQKGYVNEVGQEWLYDTDGSGKYYSAQADYTPDHFKNKETALDESIFEMLTGQPVEKASNNYLTGLGEMNIKKVSQEPYNPFKSIVASGDDKKVTEPIIEKIISNNETETEKEKIKQPEITASTTENKPVLLSDFFKTVPKKTAPKKEPEKKPEKKPEENIEEKPKEVEKKIKIAQPKIIEQPKINEQPKPIELKQNIPNPIEPKPIEQSKLKPIRPKQVEPEKKVSIKPIVKKELENKQKEKTKEQLEEVKQKVTQSEVKPITGSAEKNKTALDQDKTLIISNFENNKINNPKVVRTKRDELIDEIINNNILEKNKNIQVEDLFNMDENLLGDILANGINKIPDNQPKSSQKIKFTNPNSINNKSKGQQKVIPDKSKQKIQLNNLKPSDADLEFQPSGSNNCFVFVAAALLRYFGKENNIKGLENVKEQDLLKKYGIKRNGANNIKNKEVGKFENDFSYVRNTMYQNQTMSMGDIVEAIHDLSGDKAALNIKLISRHVLKENTEEDKEAKKSLKDIINYGVKNKNRPVGLLLGGDKGVGHYILVTGLTEDKNGFIYRNSTYKPETERTWTWDDLFRAHKHFQVCFLENTDKEPINQKDYTDISKPVTAKKNTKLDQGFVDILNSIEDEEERNRQYQEMMYWKKQGEEKEANEIEADKKRVFTTLDDNAIDKHLQHIDYYFYNDDDTKRSYFSLRPKKKP